VDRKAKVNAYSDAYHQEESRLLRMKHPPAEAERKRLCQQLAKLASAAWSFHNQAVSNDLI
jgi:hypothetical protein